MERKEYRERLKELSRRRGIKVLAGMRRSGKSALLSMFAEDLHAEGVPPEHIIAIDFDELHYEDTLDYAALHSYIEGHLQQGENIYLFLDELANAEDFEKIVGSLYLNRRLDIYLATSHAGLLQRELATVLSGGYGELPVLPLSFSEYLEEEKNRIEEDAQEPKELLASCMDYIQQSGLPGAFCLSGEENARLRREYLEGCLSSLLLWEVAARWQFRDACLLKSLLCFLYGHLGAALSPAKIAALMKEKGKLKRLSAHTVSDYLQALAEAFLIYRVPRFDVHNSRILQSTEKHYAVDLGFSELLLGKKELTEGMMENLVYLELRRRGFQVYIGRVGTREISFVAIKKDPVYIQITSSRLLARKLHPLQQIRDQYPKYVLTLENDEKTNYQGIHIMSVMDFLLKKEIP